MKRASEIGINQRTFDGLVAVRDKLRNGKFKHLPQCAYEEAEEDEGFLPELGRRVLGWFNMSQDYESVKNGECGQVGCIAGWLNIELEGAETDPEWDYRHPIRGNNLVHLMSARWNDKTYGSEGMSPLHDLFYPQIDSDHWDEITPPVAADAIDYFLKTGNSEEAWPAVTGYPRG